MALKNPLRRKAVAAPNQMTLFEHFGELRRRLVVCVIAIALGGLVAFFFYPQILHVLQEPYCQANHGDCALYITAPLDGLTLRIKMALFGGFFLSLPVLLFQIWRFIVPALRPQERNYAIPFVAASVLLFALGAYVAYVSFEHALAFLGAIGGPNLHQIYNPNQYLTLILMMMLIFGLTFEFPVLLVALQLAKVITPKQLLAQWRWAVIGITVAAAVFTPSGDPFSMLVLAIPLVAFYFLAIGIGKIFGR
ncbi:MAG: twin-arginine translocase subunit TatC [Actinobacteria bacterium]|jgi:sec-independent protein translocase protein TatC|nr:twin-arginine translocase subunit TatC [Actinomycetota bacterium]